MMQLFYDQETLTDLLIAAGFKDVRVCEVGQSSHPELRDVERHFQTLPEAFNRLETMILEATK